MSAVSGLGFRVFSVEVVGLRVWALGFGGYGFGSRV